MCSILYPLCQVCFMTSLEGEGDLMFSIRPFKAGRFYFLDFNLFLFSS
jgi:hypothetical protein